MSLVYITPVTYSLSLLGLVIIDKTTIEQLLDNTETSVQSSVVLFILENDEIKMIHAHIFIFRGQ
jgi:hypothetical protein